MKKLTLGLLLFFLAVTGCSNWKKKAAIPPPPLPGYQKIFNNQKVSRPTIQLQEPAVVNKYYLLPYFNSIEIAGDAQVILAQGAPSISINGYSVKVAKLKSNVTDHTLSISNADPTMTITINAPSLNKITIAGHTRLFAQNYQSNQLNIFAFDDSSAQLRGTYNIEEIVSQTTGTISVAWLESLKTKISASSGTVLVAGKTNNLEAALSSSAYLNAKYLRAENVKVLAKSHAHADVWSKQSLNAYAKDQSSIYYFRRPIDLTVVSQNQGNVFYWERLP
jgi:hypothetical protein